ncbi:MAG: hypothetical protein RBR97_19665 [Bacteroidales bacterium]|nr:hypothetical protein [Bacteroidales bacterium]
MKITRKLFIVIITLIITSCGVPQNEYDKLQAENERLKKELDECQNGEERLIAVVEKAYLEKDFELAKKSIDKLNKNHPHSHKNKEFSQLLNKIERAEIEEKLRKEEEEKEKNRLANLNNTGMWSVNYYVDEFGEKTKQGYITNTSLIRGTFSNTATQDSKLDVRFLISNSSDISFELFEYAGNNPVKAYATTKYTVLVQDKDGNRLRLKATNYSDRISFDKTASRQVHNAIMKSGTLKFRIVEDETPTTIYEFSIQNADWYENAYRKLKES